VTVRVRVLERQRLARKCDDFFVTARMCESLMLFLQKSLHFKLPHVRLPFGQVSATCTK
jgi:hypothetical protein